MVNSAAPMAVHSSGMQVASGLPPQVTVPVSNMAGGLINAAAAKTADSMAEQAAHAKAGGVTMRGSGRKQRGGGVITVPPVAEGGTVPGVSFAKNHADLISTANQLKASAVYDGLVGSQP